MEFLILQQKVLAKAVANLIQPVNLLVILMDFQGTSVTSESFGESAGISHSEGESMSATIGHTEEEVKVSVQVSDSLKTKVMEQITAKALMKV